MNYTNPHLLWSVDELKSRLQDPKLVLMDMRPPEAYSNGHIPGARSFDIFGISLIDTRPEPLDAFLWLIEHLIQAKGVNSDSTVVVYDDIAGMRSARLFWFLEFFGHDDVHMLNGGFNAWEAGGLPVTHEAVVPKAGNFKMKPRPERIATAEDVRANLKNPSAVIVDTRSDAEYTGQLVRSRRGGAIPGAVHLEWTNNLNEKGFFKSADELSKMYAEKNIGPDKEVIPHCQGAYRSAHTYLALRLIGYPKIRNYLGSWGEWGNRLDLPIEHPTEP
ncbi:MAG TPA: sulfurtransferase [Terriglobia bacterium]|nr:sulfurtransferase [Terriglobia bacterium]